MPTPSSRLLALLSLLQARRDWPGPLLAERMAVSSRTVRRDVERLRELGYRITSVRGPDGGYRLAAGADLPPLLLDDEQAVALAVSLQLATVAGAGIEEAALRALTTVRQLLPTRLRRRVDALEVVAVAPPSQRASEVGTGVLLTVSEAIRAREVLRFDYAVPGGDDVVRRRVEPHHLVSYRGRWYVVAWDLERDDWRTFRVDRLAPRTPTGPRFAERAVPGGDVAAFVTARFGGTEATSWPCQGEVLVDLPLAQVAPYVGDGVAEPAGPTRTRLVVGAWSWPALAAWLLRFDTDLEVVDPPELRAAFASLVDRARRASASGV